MVSCVDPNISKIADALSQKIAVMELSDNCKSDNLKILYKEFLNTLLLDGVQKTRVSLYGMQIIVNKKGKLVNIKGFLPQLTNENSRGIYAQAAMELGLIEKKEKKNYNTDYNYELENIEYIKLIEETANFLQKSVLLKLRKNHFASLLKGKKDITLHDWRAQLDIAKSFFDHKVKVPIHTQHILLYNIATMATHNEAAKEYFSHCVSAYTIIGKQMSKYKRGAIKKVPTLFEPQDRISAMMFNYLGVRCICDSWRVIKYESFNYKSICMDCDLVTDIIQPIKCNTCSILFYKEDFDEIKNKRKCPYCKEEFSTITIKNIQATKDKIKNGTKRSKRK